MSHKALEQYLSLMTVVRRRLDAIEKIKDSKGDLFSRAEIAAFHGRKIIEGIAFGCLVAVENGLKQIPPDAKGQWNADKIFTRLKSRNLDTFPSPSILRDATEDEKKNYPGIKITIDGQPERRLSPEELRKMYAEIHKWLHEINPYVEQGRQAFLAKNEMELWKNLARLELFIERHTVSIAGEMFFCTLRDKQDGATKVFPLSKNASLYPR